MLFPIGVNMTALALWGDHEIWQPGVTGLPDAIVIEFAPITSRESGDQI